MNVIHHLQPDTQVKPGLNKIHKFFTFSHRAMTGQPWIELFNGWYVHDLSLGGDWIVISTTPSPRRIGTGPGTWLYIILSPFVSKTCVCKKMADYYNLGLETKNSVAKHFTETTSVPFIFTWSFVCLVEKLYNLYRVLTKNS